jgi:hypothetical protein
MSDLKELEEKLQTLAVDTKTQELVPAEKQTKEWRNQQTWYKGGKKNECENFQVAEIRLMIDKKHQLLDHVGTRINDLTFELSNVLRVSNSENPLIWTEDFDLEVLADPFRVFFNLKFIVGDGGSQTRSIREVRHFIQSQHAHITKHGTKNVFVNVLDGDTSAKYTHWLKKMFPHEQIYIGDSYGLSGWLSKYLTMR